MGVVLALLTMLAAGGVMFLVLFGTPFVSAAAVFALWPRIFSPEFTQWVFGAEQVSFWKLFLLFLAAGAAVRLLRRRTWQRK